MDKKLIGIIIISFFLAIFLMQFLNKVSIPLALYDSSRYYYYANYLVENNKLMIYDDLSYGGRINASPPMQTIIIYLMYSFFRLFLNLYDFMKYYSFIILSIISFLIYFFARKKLGNVGAISCTFFFIFNQKTLRIFESGVIKHSQLLLLFFVMGLFILEYYKSNKKAFFIYSLILPLISLESIIIIIILLIYSFINKNDSKKYLALGFGTGCIYWLILLIVSGTWNFLPENFYSSIYEMEPINFYELIESFNFSLIFLIPFLIPKIKKNLKNHYFFLIVSIIYILFFRQKHFIYLILFMAISISYGFLYIFKKSKKFAAILFFLIAIYYLFYFFSVSSVVAWERPDNYTLEAYTWIKENSNENDTIFDCINHGSEILAYTERRNIGDNFFEFIGNLPFDVENDYMALMAAFDLQTPYYLFIKYESDYFVYSKYLRDSCYWWVNESEKALFPEFFETQEFTPFMFKAYKKQVPYLKTVFENEKIIIFEII